MKKVTRSPLVMDVVNIANVQKQLERLSDLLGKIQKALGEYLERERASFPRYRNIVLYQVVFANMYIHWNKNCMEVAWIKIFLLILCYFKFLDSTLSEMKIYWRSLETVKMLPGFKNTSRKCLLVLPPSHWTRTTHKWLDFYPKKGKRFCWLLIFFFLA